MGAGSANVQSLEALKDVRMALIAFGERTETALGELRSKIDRTMAWLQQDRPLYWRDQERRAYDGVASARVAYETCRLRTVGGRHSECIEEKIAFQRARVRLEYCQQKMEVVRRWNLEAGRQVDEYRGRSAPLQRLLEDQLPPILARITRMIDALEAYAEIHLADTEASPVSPGSTSPGSTSLRSLGDAAARDDVAVPDVAAESDSGSPPVATSRQPLPNQP